LEKNYFGEDKMNVIVAVSNKQYIKHTYSLFGNLRNLGNWKGDLAIVLSEDIDKEDYHILNKNNIQILKCNDKIYPYFAKFFIFHPFFKQWDRILYLDQDHIIRKDVNLLFNQIGEFLISKEPFKIKQYFSDNDKECFEDLKRNYNINKDGYISSCMLFESKLINDNTLDNLFKLKTKYESINRHTGIEGGTEQPIINLYFYDKFKHLENVTFIDTIDSNTILNHTCRWGAPWKYEGHFNYYQTGLRNFYEI
jgi:hypothetical protein